MSIDKRYAVYFKQNRSDRITAKQCRRIQKKLNKHFGNA